MSNKSGSAATKKSGSRSNNWQVVALLAVLVVLVIISVATALMANGTISLEEAKPSVGSMTDAESICNAEIRQEKGSVLNSFMVDDRSSRYDEEMGKFKVFYQVEVYLDESRQTGTGIYYVNCFVSARRGIITQIDFLEQADFKPKAVRRTHGNPFGM